MNSQGLVHSGVTMVRRLYTGAYEKRYNIHTGFQKLRFEDGRYPDSQPYEPTDYFLIHRFVGPLMPQPSDVVFDIGCGMGRVLCVFARMDVKKCIGIELCPELAAVARENAERLHGRKAPIEVRVADASKADYSEGTIFWMFNPFGAPVILAMLEQIQKTLAASPRWIRIAYVNPVHQSVFQSCSWLRCTGRQTPWWSNKVVTYWSNQ